MKKHPYHDLWMHEDGELSSHLGSRVCERTTLHDWPLSTVQKVVCEDGRKLIYKSQYGPTVEAEFYAAARAPILPRAETLWKSDGHSCMLIEFIDAPLVQALGLQGNAVVRMGREIQAEIRKVSGKPPCFLDIGDERKWLALVDATIMDLKRLVAEGRFTQVNADSIASLARCGRSDAVVSAATRDVGIIHGDTKGDNVFVTSDGYRVIDWQRTKRGPRDVDLVAFLHGHGINPTDHVDAGTVGIFHFLGVWWATQCQTRWIPDARSYDNAVAGLADRLGKVLQ